MSDIRAREPAKWLTHVRPFARNNEHQVLRLSFAGIVIGRGEIDVATAPLEQGRGIIGIAWSVESVGLAAQLFRANMNARTWVNRETGTWTAMEFQAVGGIGRDPETMRMQAVCDVAGGVMRATLWRKDGTRKESTEPLPKTPLHDLGTLVLMMRGWNAPSRGYGLVQLGKTAGSVPLYVVVEGRESIVTPMGRFAAVRIAGFVGRQEKRRLTMWISNDGNRVPLRLEMPSKYGSFVVETVRYSHG